ncbi:MAG TPA: hypothetical protein VGQ86_08780, partial [Candidatus Limnocylindria bacterium]|nr:hypothetical protein [Candidatus Limnocylindria bacterium]
MNEPIWKRRFRAPMVTFPTWARDNPDRLLYLSNAGGKFEVCAWDKSTGEKRQVTDRPEGTGYPRPEPARSARRVDLVVRRREGERARAVGPPAVVGRRARNDRA